MLKDSVLKVTLPREKQNAVNVFTQKYVDMMFTGLTNLDKNVPISVANEIRAAASRKKSTIYLFGNGGSHAIMVYFGLLIREKLRQSNLTARVNVSLDFHESHLTVRKGYRALFVEKLKGDGADSDDLVIVASGSGDSHNIVRVAEYCKQKGIPLLSFAGFKQGKLQQMDLEHKLTIGIDDQQVCEDTMQSVLYVIGQILGDLGKVDHNALTDSYLTLANSFLNGIGNPICDLSTNIANAFFDSRAVYVLAPEGGALSTSAEHTAHNLNWDTVYQIENPPRRVIYSTPTATDYSGIANDRLVPGAISCQQLDKAVKSDVLLMYVYNPDSKAVRTTLQTAHRNGMDIYLFAMQQLSSLVDPFLYANITQTVGHMTGRIVRMLIKERLGLLGGSEDITNCLGEDMAQRRLIYEKHGL